MGLQFCKAILANYTAVVSQCVITFQYVINYYKLERICNAIASQFVINYYKLERIKGVGSYLEVVRPLRRCGGPKVRRSAGLGLFFEKLVAFRGFWSDLKWNLPKNRSL